jgi:crotonobetainyl-CoA:carnitine CoA-transferase CaiB-like acyl-CoA transferase
VFQAEDAYLTIGVANNSLWERMCAAIDRPDVAKDARFATDAARVANREALVPLLNQVFGARPAAHWLERLEAAGVPGGRIKTVAEVCESEHLMARGMVVRLSHKKAGPYTAMGVPIRLWDTPGRAVEPAPLLGQHTDEILTRLCRMSRRQVERLRTASVV